MHIKNTIKDDYLEIINDTNDRIYSESLCYYKIKELLKKEYPGFKVMKKNQRQYPVGLTSIPYYIEFRNKTENFIFYDRDHAIRDLAKSYTKFGYITLNRAWV
ncbi:MAG: hypothetical protein GY804_09875 [Alphaproteobacteria bacterium]|nr:hypothetical protein [Alphaproteobacteria bacterium]